MVASFQFVRRSSSVSIPCDCVLSLLPDWRGGGERCMFISPHDDDVVIGSGLMMQAMRQAGAEVHCVVTTDGSMGYCSADQRDRIADIRNGETRLALETLGLSDEYLHFLGFFDSYLAPYRGRRPARAGDPAVVEGYCGLQNSFTHVLRVVRPTRVFVPTWADYHPDHRVVYEELMISIFHASGAIWPELGAPLDAPPVVYEYATYCDFSQAPQIKVMANADGFSAKLRAIEAFASQAQIGELVQQLRDAGPKEYFREIQFRLYSPSTYDALFAGKDDA